MSDDQIGTVFYSVAFPMCMIILAYLVWRAVRRREAAAPDVKRETGPAHMTIVGREHGGTTAA